MHQQSGTVSVSINTCVLQLLLRQLTAFNCFIYSFSTYLYIWLFFVTNKLFYMLAITMHFNI